MKNRFCLFLLCCILEVACTKPPSVESVQNPINEPAHTSPLNGFNYSRCLEQWCRVRVSYYGNNDGLAGRTTASGGRFNPQALTVAHRNLPFGTRLKFKNPENGRELIATVTDRGPQIKGREFDLSFAAARQLGIDVVGVGLLDVKIET